MDKILLKTGQIKEIQRLASNIIRVKLHLVTSGNRVFHSMDLTKASVHDVTVLKEIKYANMSNATLVGDKRHISKEVKIDLFESCNIN